LRWLFFASNRTFNIYHVCNLSSIAKVTELGAIWGKEINEIRAQSVHAVKLKYPIKGYDLMLKNQEKHLRVKN